MYRTSLNNRDRAVTIALVALVHAGLAIALLNVSGHLDLTPMQPALEIFDVRSEPPPPPIVEVVRDADKDKPKKDEGAASAKNIKSQATPVKRPEPRVVVPATPPIVTSPTPNTGAAPTQGASNVVGPGTGAGGVGTGTGSGGSGGGSGGGGGGGKPTEVSILRKVDGNAYPAAIRARWPRGGRIFTRVRISPEGRVIQCDVLRSFGDKNADDWTCALLRDRATFKPATDASGKPVAGWFGYVQSDRDL
jgi:protein TonB